MKITFILLPVQYEQLQVLKWQSMTIKVTNLTKMTRVTKVFSFSKLFAYCASNANSSENIQLSVSSFLFAPVLSEPNFLLFICLFLIDRKKIKFFVSFLQEKNHLEMDSPFNETADPSPQDILKNKFTDVICSNCNKGIEGKIVSALGRTWHPEHFNCSNCKKAITGDRFNQDKGSPFCEDCYANIFLKRCYKCSLPIKEKIIVALEQFWHQEHFTCNDCNVELTGLSFFEKDKVAYCQNCHMQKFAPKCKGCNKPITDTAIMALGEKWHQKCFLCSQCNRPVTEATFEVVEDRPLCSSCSRQRK